MSLRATLPSGYQKLEETSVFQEPWGYRGGAQPRGMKLAVVVWRGGLSENLISKEGGGN